jgi:hypothetical protein
MSQIKVDSIVPRGGLPAGASGGIIQIVQAVKLDTFSLTGTGDFTDITGLSVNITPSSASNKILVMLHVNVGSANIPCIRLMRGSTAIGIGNADGDRRQTTTQTGFTNNHLSGAATPVFLDSPSTTSQITYKAQLSPEHSTHTVYINRCPFDYNNYQGYRTISTITGMEVTM